MLASVSVRVRLAIAALAVTGGIVALEGVVLERVAAWAERDRDSYPYVAGEDPIRLLLPAKFETPGEDRLMILGPSAAHEGILYEQVEAAFPAFEVLTVGISTGTMDDVLLALDLIERLHGADKVPRAIILGVTFRLVANVPRRFGDRIRPNSYAPLHEAIRRYGPYDVVPGEHRSRLVDKGALGKLKAAFTLHTKKAQPRYRAGLAALAGAAIGEKDLAQLHEQRWTPVELPRSPFEGDNLFVSFGYFSELGVLETARYWLPYYRSPYYTAYVPKRDRGDIRERLEDGWIPEQSWAGDEAFVAKQFGDLRALCERLGIQLFVVNLAESSISYDLYPEGTYARYLELLDENLEGVPFIDLREHFERAQYMDEIHPLHPVAPPYTERVIEFVRQHAPPGFGQPAATP